MQKFRVYFWDVILAEGEKPGENPALRKDLGVFRHATNGQQPPEYQIAQAFVAVARRASHKLDEQDFDGASFAKKAVNHFEVVHVESGATCFLSVEKKIVIDRKIDFYDVPAAPEGLAQSIFGQCLLALNERPVLAVVRRIFRLLGRKDSVSQPLLDDYADAVTVMVQKFHERGGAKSALASEYAAPVKKGHARKRTKSDEAAQADSP